MNRTIIVAAALTLIAGRAALAADLPPAPGPAPQPAPMYVEPVANWSGIYFGTNGGYGFGSSRWTSSVGLDSSDFGILGAFVGPTLGVNFQSGAFVFGIEGDFDGSWLDGTSGASCSPTSCETKNTWLATARGRVGYAADNVLFYGTAGGAYGNIEGNTLGTSFQKESRPGWTAGAGVEVSYADHWTTRFEYLFVDLENATLAGGGSAPSTTTTVKFNASLIRVGVDYKFR